MTFEERFVESYKEYIKTLDELEKIEDEIIKEAIKKGRNDIINDIEAERILRESLPY